MESADGAECFRALFQTDTTTAPATVPLDTEFSILPGYIGRPVAVWSVQTGVMCVVRV